MLYCLRMQCLRSFCPLRELLAARAVCADWCRELGAQVSGIQLPSHLWQVARPKQEEELERLLGSFWRITTARLLCESELETDAAVARRVLRVLARVRTLCRMQVRGVRHEGDWQIILHDLGCMGAQLGCLELEQVKLPAPEQVAQIASLSGLRQLCLASPYTHRLAMGHLTALARLSQLQALELSFRTAQGSVDRPMPLDAVARLTQLTRLELRFTGAQRPLSLSSMVAALWHCWVLHQHQLRHAGTAPMMTSALHGIVKHQA
jgi:hypothetical protein